MNQKLAKKLRRAARIAAIRSSVIDFGRDYQSDVKGSVTLRPLTERAIYQGLKRTMR